LVIGIKFNTIWSYIKGEIKMTYTGKSINYKEYRIKIWKDVWGYYQPLIEKYEKHPHYDYKYYKYINQLYNLFTKDIKEAKKVAKKYIDKIRGK
jgi:hypothetical protein